MAGLVAAFLNPNVKPKYKIKKDYGDTFTPAVASFVGNIIRDAAVSAGQVANEAANRGIGGPAAIPARVLFGPDYLARLGGKVSPEIEESMKGEVTPMDVVNVASLIPIPVGAGAKAGLAGLKLGAKAQRTFGKGAFSLGERAGQSKYTPSFFARIAESAMRNPISANYINNAPELALNAPALVNTWKSDASTEEKAALTAAILAGTSASGIKDAFKLSRARKAATKDVQNFNPASPYVRAEQRGSSKTSDISMAMDTDMPLEAMVAFSGSQPGYRTRFYASMYENNNTFRKLVDDFNAGKLTVDEAFEAGKKLTGELPSGMGLGIKKRNWEYWDKKKNTGSFVNDPTDPNTNKLDTLYETLSGKPSGDRIPWDTKEKNRALELVKTGRIDRSKIVGKNQAERDASLQQLYFDWYKKNVLKSNNPWVIQSARERLYGSSGISDTNIK